MSRQRYSEEFKIEAVKQVTEKGKPVAQRLGMSVHNLYAWIKVYSNRGAIHASLAQSREPSGKSQVF